MSANRAQVVVEYIRSLPDFAIVTSIDEPYGHMGATLSDAVLQAGVKYDTVVTPRIEHLLAAYPHARTTTEFARVLDRFGVEAVLGWKRGRKPDTLRELVNVLLENGIETEEQLRAWLDLPQNLARLQQIKGIKEKTAHYLHVLVGSQNVAVDRHLFRLLAEAGVPASSYNEAHDVSRHSAIIMGINESILDHSIWRYMSERPVGYSASPTGVPNTNPDTQILPGTLCLKKSMSAK